MKRSYDEQIAGLKATIAAAAAAKEKAERDLASLTAAKEKELAELRSAKDGDSAAIRKSYDGQIATLKAEKEKAERDLATAKADKEKAERERAEYLSKSQAADLAARTAESALVAAKRDLTGAIEDRDGTRKKITDLAGQILTGTYNASKFGTDQDKPIRNILQKVQNLTKASSSASDSACNLVLLVNYFMVKLYRERDGVAFYNAMVKSINEAINSNVIQYPNVIRVVTSYLTHAEKAILSKVPGFYTIEESEADRKIFFDVIGAITRNLSKYVNLSFRSLVRFDEVTFSIGFYNYDQSKTDIIKSNNYFIYDPQEKTFKESRTVTFPFNDESLLKYRVIKNGIISEPRPLTTSQITGGLDVVTRSRVVTYHTLFAFLLTTLQQYLNFLNGGKKLSCELPATLKDPIVGLTAAVPAAQAAAPPAAKQTHASAATTQLQQARQLSAAASTASSRSTRPELPSGQLRKFGGGGKRTRRRGRKQSQKKSRKIRK
jgi:hypothetical protein